MFRTLCSRLSCPAVQTLFKPFEGYQLVQKFPQYVTTKPTGNMNYSVLTNMSSIKKSFEIVKMEISSNFLKPKSTISSQIRTVIKYSLRKGKKETVEDVIHRFYRLNWGIWLRSIGGKDCKKWKKRKTRKRANRQLVFTNAQQTKMLDRMVSHFWKKPKYYIDDPYEPYHERENFPLTRKKPWRPEGCDYE